MSLAAGHLSASVSRDTGQTVTVTIREDTKNLLIGYVEITLVPTGARVEGWHGKDESDTDNQIILHAEVPS